MTPFRVSLLAFALGAAACATSSEPEGGSGPSSLNEANKPGKAAEGDAGSFGAIAPCTASPAPAVFGNALCLCGDLHDVGNLKVTGTAGNLGSIGVNGTSYVINHTDIDGSWGSAKGFSAIGDVHVKKNFYTAGNVDIAGNLDVTGNVEVGGNVSGLGRLAVGGELRAKGDDTLIGREKIAARGAYTTPLNPPCACDGSNFFDVSKAIADAKVTNDNAAKGVASTLAGIGAATLKLQSGRYFFDNVAQIGLQKLQVEGAVSIYIEGSLEGIGADIFQLAPGATLDLYVSKTIRTVGYVNLGDKTDPGALRIYLGGDDAVSLSIGAQIFHGTLYAPRAKIIYIGYTIIEGGLFAKELVGVGDLEIRAARPKPPTGCTPSAGSSGGTTETGTPEVK